MGFNDISFFGGGYHNGAIKTPYIDSIGYNGVSYHNAYAGHATCAPSRAALMTGVLGSKLGYEFTPISPAGGRVLGGFGIDKHPGIYHADKAVGVGYENMTLPDDVVTLANAMKYTNNSNSNTSTNTTSYHTIQIGKWHLGTTPKSSPTARGFDESLGVPLISLYLPQNHPESMNCYLTDPLDDFLWANVRYQVKVNNATGYTLPQGHFTDYLADEAVKAMEANQYGDTDTDTDTDPFFMYLAFTAIHSPLQALKSDYDSLERYTELSHCDKIYASMILSLDRAIGKVLTGLEDNGLTDNTMVIFTSDNGGPGYIDQRDINAPYRGWKASFFEGGIRVPLFIQYPSVIQPNTVIKDQLVSHVDIFPTILEAASKRVLGYSVDGVSLWDGIRASSGINSKQVHGNGVDIVDIVGGDTDIPVPGQNRSLFFRSGHYKAVIYRGFDASPTNSNINTNSCTNTSTNASTNTSISCDSSTIPIWKYQTSENPMKTWLFDLLHDPTEQINVIPVPNPNPNPPPTPVSDHYIETVLQFMRNLLHEEDMKQSPHPIWESRSESPILIDKISSDSVVDGDEYIYWPN